MSRYSLEVLLHFVAIGLYASAAAIWTYSVLWARPERNRLAAVLGLAGLVPHGVAIASRWIASGHGPYMARHEVLTGNSWALMLALPLLLLAKPAWRFLAIVAVPVAILMMGIGLFANPELRQLPPTLKSIWLVFHILFAKLAAISFLLSVASASTVLFRDRPRPPAWIARFPEGPVLDALIARFTGFGFIFWSLAVAAGAIWARDAWGRYWGWDAVETWSLVSWLMYGALLHARLFFRLAGKTLAWSTIGVFVLFVLTLLIFPFLIPTMHTAYFQ
jgi:ABC-type transport system involved in cytochrome c biogenesis permease subunit